MILRSQPRLAAAALAVALAAAPAFAEGQQQRPAKTSERAVVGLPIYTSDGKAVGRAVATGIDEDNQAVLVGEIERPLGLGLGPRAVAIPADLFVRKRGRIELTLTQAEVKARLGRSR